MFAAGQAVINCPLWVGSTISCWSHPSCFEGPCLTLQVHPCPVLPANTANSPWHSSQHLGTHPPLLLAFLPQCPPWPEAPPSPCSPRDTLPLHLEDRPTSARPHKPGTGLLQAQSIYDSPPGMMRGGPPPLSPIIEPSVTPSMTSSPSVVLPPAVDSSSEAGESTGRDSLSRGSTPHRGPTSGASPHAPDHKSWYSLGSPGQQEVPQGNAEPPRRQFVRAASRDLSQQRQTGLETIYATPQFSPSSTPGTQTPLSSGMQTPPRNWSQAQQLPQQLPAYPPIPYHRNERVPQVPGSLPPGEPLTDFEDGRPCAPYPLLP